ncbi:nucleoside triphosphate pyrophosphohydrolase [Streptomyces sp. NPDC015237]|uniref:nucleoside triphosphate pyrophosphohydrolase n=1 Tax=Streptomyces sp. NPDC015237 TaxID=3364949 RepID=UPI0036F93D90
MRDRIPQTIRADGVEQVACTAAREEHRGRRRDKLGEEVAEFLEADEDSAPEELADVLEVVRAPAGDLGVDADQLAKIREAKAGSGGGFADRIVWTGTMCDRTPATSVTQKAPEVSAPRQRHASPVGPADGLSLPGADHYVRKFRVRASNNPLCHTSVADCGATKFWKGRALRVGSPVERHCSGMATATGEIRGCDLRHS